MKLPSLQNRGVVLPVVLWFVVVIVSMLAIASTNTSLSIRTADNIKTSVLMKYAAEAGVYNGIYLVHRKLMADNNISSTMSINNSYANGFSSIVDIVAESEKLDINRIDEEDIDRIIKAIRQSEYGDVAATVEAITRAYSNMQKNNSHGSLSRYATVYDIDVRGRMAGMEQSLSSYMTIYRNNMNVYSLYSSTTGPGGDITKHNLVVYAIINRNVGNPFRILEWKS